MPVVLSPRGKTRASFFHRPYIVLAPVVDDCGFEGDDAIRDGGAFVDSGPVLSLAPGVNLHCAPPKRTRLLRGKRVGSLDALPDECLAEILRRLNGKRERSAAACVSRRWLMLLSGVTERKHPLPDLNEDVIVEVGADPELSRCLEGEGATDSKLAAVAVATAAELAKLTIRSSERPCRVTDLGLNAVARSCASLRALTVWDAPWVGDDGLLAIAEGCSMLEKLDLCCLPNVSDKGLVAIAERCPNLVCLTVDSCRKVGDGVLQAIGQCCRNLQFVSVSSCPLVSDEGVAGLFSAGVASSTLRKIKLQALNLTDVSLGVVGYYGKELTELVLADLPAVDERGFWVMGNAGGLRKITTFAVKSLDGITDTGLESIAKSCPFLQQVVVRRSLRLSDAGMRAFSQAAGSLESLRLEDCNSLTMEGIIALLLNCHGKLRSFSLSRCGGVADIPPGKRAAGSPAALRSLAIRHCPGFDDSSMFVLAELCPRLQQLDLRGLTSVTESGLAAVLAPGEQGKASLVTVSLNGCPNVSDGVISILVKVHGETLESIGLEGCGRITDASLVAIAGSCGKLRDLDVSFTAVTDGGVSALASSGKLDNLTTLSLAHCPRISNRCLPFFPKWSLNGLNLQNCAMISQSSVGLLEEKMWWCDILF